MPSIAIKSTGRCNQRKPQTNVFEQQKRGTKNCADLVTPNSKKQLSLLCFCCSSNRCSGRFVSCGLCRRRCCSTYIVKCFGCKVLGCRQCYDKENHGQLSVDNSVIKCPNCQTDGYIGCYNNPCTETKCVCCSFNQNCRDWPWCEFCKIHCCTTFLVKCPSCQVLDCRRCINDQSRRAFKISNAMIQCPGCKAVSYNCCYEDLCNNEHCFCCSFEECSHGFVFCEFCKICCCSTLTVKCPDCKVFGCRLCYNRHNYGCYYGALEISDTTIQCPNWKVVGLRQCRDGCFSVSDNSKAKNCTNANLKESEADAKWKTNVEFIAHLLGGIAVTNYTIGGQTCAI